MRMVRLTLDVGGLGGGVRYVYVNVSYISWMRRCGGYTEVGMVGGEEFDVVEGPEDIMVMWGELEEVEGK